jgi:hypothetical protein
MQRGAGVYGLEIVGLGDVSRYSGSPLPGSPIMTVQQRIGYPEPGIESRLYGDHAVIPLIENGLLEVFREPAVASYVMPRTLSAEELLHPWLVPAAATVNGWHGRRVLHGGIVTNGTRALAVVGDKEGGKSTLLAWLALQSNLCVMADDLVVFDGDVVFAGPRCIDLRPASLAHLPEVVGTTLVRDASRYRLPLPATPQKAELVGLVVLEWSSETAVHAVAPRDRLTRILPHAMTEGVTPGVAGVLGFASYRMWRLARPRRWASLQAATDIIAGLLET